MSHSDELLENSGYYLVDHVVLVYNKSTKADKSVLKWQIQSYQQLQFARRQQ